LAYFASQNVKTGKSGGDAKLIEEGKNIINGPMACVEYHGPNGKGVEKIIPILRGQNKAYLVKALNDFISDARTNGDAIGMMISMSKRLTKEENDAVTEYLSRQ
jgi:cytochrome c553